MAFCTTADVFPFLPQDLDATTRPTAVQAEQFITDVEGEINNALLQSGVAIPPTDANVILVLKGLSRYGSLALIETALYAQKGASKSERVIEYEKKFRAGLDLIRSSPSALGGDTMISYSFPDSTERPVADADTVLY